MQPCPTYNDINTRDWYAGEDMAGESMERHSRIYKLEDTGYDPMVHYDTGEEINEKMTQALIKSMEWNDKIPTGVFYVNGTSTPYNERILDDIPNHIENPPARQEIPPGRLECGHYAHAGLSGCIGQDHHWMLAGQKKKRIHG